jgi:hypothetical protein
VDRGYSGLLACSVASPEESWDGGAPPRCTSDLLLPGGEATSPSGPCLARLNSLRVEGFTCSLGCRVTQNRVHPYSSSDCDFTMAERVKIPLIIMIIMMHDASLQRLWSSCSSSLLRRTVVLRLDGEEERFSLPGKDRIFSR